MLDTVWTDMEFHSFNLLGNEKARVETNLGPEDVQLVKYTTFIGLSTVEALISLKVLLFHLLFLKCA